MKPPLGLVEIERFYGDPAGFVREDGTISPLWERRMVMVAFPYPLVLGWRIGDKQVPALRVRVHEIVAPEVDTLFRLWNRAGLWECLKTFDGGYNWRPKRASKRLSMHAYGAAMDFNAATNELGTAGDMDPELVAIARGRGWTWGGEWKRPDPMHFQFGGGY